MSGVILTEPNPRSPRPVAHPGAWTPGASDADRAAEYGGPATRGGIVTFTPQHQPGHADGTGHGVPAIDLGAVVGGAPAIGVVGR